MRTHMRSWEAPVLALNYARSISRVRLTLKHGNQDVVMLAIVRVSKPKLRMGLQALEVDSNASETFVQWLDALRESR
jgi:hypothetical protein